MFCLAPMSAMAIETYNPGTGNAVGADGTLNGLDATTESIVVQSGNGIVVQGGGLNIGGNIYVGVDSQAAPTDQLYIETGTDATFGVRSRGPITVGGALDIRAGRDFSIGGFDGTAVNASFGSIASLGKLNIHDIDTLTSGAITGGDDLTISANIINTGTITSNGGNMTVAATGALTADDLVSHSTGLAQLSADSMQVDNVQNTAGNIKLNVTKDLTATGSVENSGDNIEINVGGTYSVAGTMKNDSAGSSIVVRAANWTVSGGDAINASVVNSGDFTAVVSGETNLEYGFDLSLMQNTNTFSLETGTLVFGNSMDADRWLHLFSNNLNSMTLIINQGKMDINSDVINGVGNADANMNLQATEIAVTGNVENLGNTLNMTATDNTLSGISVTGGVTTHSSSITNIVSAGALDIAGAVSNDGTTTLNGGTINLSSIGNTGTLNILSLTNTGKVKVTGNVSNNGGNMRIESREIDIDGALVNQSGVMNIRGSDTAGGSMSMGSIDAQGGSINIDSLVGTLAVDKSVSVTGGSLNFGSNTYGVTAGDSITVAGDLTASATAATGAGNVNVAGAGARSFIMKSTGGNITVDGNISAVANDAARGLLIDSAVIDVNGDVNAANMGTLIFGDTLATHLNVAGAMVSNAGGLIDMNVADVEVGSLSGSGKFIARGHTIEATDNANNTIDIQNGIWFDGSDPANGLVVKDTTDLTLLASGTGADINVSGGGVAVSSGNKLTLNATDEINVAGALTIDGTLDVNPGTNVTFTNILRNTGTVTIDGVNLTLNDLNNSGAGSVTINATDALTINDLTNSANIDLTARNTIQVNALAQTAGVLDITAPILSAYNINIQGGVVNLDTNLADVSADVIVNGDVVQGGTNGMLNLSKDNFILQAENIKFGADFNVLQNHAVYNATKAFSITGDVVVDLGASADVTSETYTSGKLTNDGTFSVRSDSVTMGDVINSGTLNVVSRNSTYKVNSFTTIDGFAMLSGVGLESAGAFTLSGRLTQYAMNSLGGDVNVLADNYSITASTVDITSIVQNSGAMTINTGDIHVTGDIYAKNLTIAAYPKSDDWKPVSPNWLNVAVDGNVSGGVGFIGVEKMVIGGNYIFNNDSKLMAAILPENSKNYWASVSLNNDSTLGQITNNSGTPEPLITVNGKFISDLTSLNTNVGQLNNSQVGINISSIVDQGTAIWLLHADGGIDEKLQDEPKLRDVVVQYCNADGSKCFNYLDALEQGSNNKDDLPVYLSVRDTDGDGIPDSVYVVFDPRFGGPVEVFKIQPIVDNEAGHTEGEYITAGALDDLIAGVLREGKWDKADRIPIYAFKQDLKGTNLEKMANELYARMEQYQTDRNGAGLKGFSRLFQPREIEQVVGSIALNEHTSFRDFEDRMFDEFIWNRNRKLKKAWLDIDFGMYNQRVSDDKKVDGDRFSVTGGFDWKKSETLLLGVTGRVSHMSGSNFDEMDISYKPGQSITGRVDVDVANTNVGLGGYLMQILNEKFRVYGNAYLDLHWLDITRDQNYVDTIDGSGTAFSFMSEWGLMHDWLNQYIVGNLYARVGYNFGFSVTEKAAGSEYMKLESDGYLVLTPGYSLIAQKRIYPTAFFQMRPYLSVGVEYDVLGNPDNAQFKFAHADKFTNYAVEIDPLWANGGGGIEFLGASGWQVGLDYRYQYNADIQMHKIKLSGSYRF